MIDLSRVLKEKGLSNDKAAELARRYWKERSGAGKYPSARSLGAKVGQLAGGDAKWWRKRPAALDALAWVLGCKSSELLPDEQLEAASIPFTEFPELAPLLMGQEPCSVRVEFNSLADLAKAAINQGRRVWITAPSGTGKTLAVKILRQQLGTGLNASIERRLCDASADGDVPLLVEVTARDEDTDASAVDQLSQRRSATCVLASFSRPTTTAPSEDWVDITWTMDSTWRARFVAWVAQRIPEAKRPPLADLEEWFDVEDPDGSLFTTPRDVLQAVAWLSRGGLKRRDDKLRALRRDTLGRELGAQASPWLKHQALDAIEGLLRARLSDTRVRFGPLSVSQWASLLPATATRDEVAQSRKSKRKTNPGAQHDADRVPPSATQAIHMLIDAGVLRSVDHGFDTARWIRVGVEREAVATEVTSSSLAWTYWAVDRSRAQSVDDMLMRYSTLAQLFAVARRVVNRDVSNFETVAAVEALVAAFGQRALADGLRIPREEVATLQALGRMQLRLMSVSVKPWTALPLLPLTRYAPGSRSDLQHIAWVSQAWAFSLRVPRPDALEHAAGWAFPGWERELRLNDAPEGLPGPHKREATANPSWTDLLATARECLRKCTDEVAPDDLPPLFLPWLLIDGPPNGWDIPSLAERIRTHVGVADMLSVALQAEVSETRTRLVDILFKQLLPGAGGDPFRVLEGREAEAPPFARMLYEHVTPELFADACTPRVFQRGGVGDTLLKLPRLLPAVLRVAARHMRDTGRSFHDLDPALEALGPEHIDLLVNIVAADKYSTGLRAAELVWVYEPQRAVTELERALHSGIVNERYAWLLASTPAEYPALLDLLERHSAGNTDWASRWLSQVLPIAGSSAPRVFAMMNLGL